MFKAIIYKKARFKWYVSIQRFHLFALSHFWCSVCVVKIFFKHLWYSRQYTAPTMNFSPFGGHFSTAIPAIHQFAAKFTHENTAGNTLCPTQDNSNRYTANGIPSFTQHHPPQQQMLSNSKYQGSYMNQTVSYSHQVNLCVWCARKRNNFYGLCM